LAKVESANREDKWVCILGVLFWPDFSTRRKFIFVALCKNYLYFANNLAFSELNFFPQFPLVFSTVAALKCIVALTSVRTHTCWKNNRHNRQNTKPFGIGIFSPAAGIVPTQPLHSRHRGKKYNENGQGIFLFLSK
jgi:hypothetical protein